MNRFAHAVASAELLIIAAIAPALLFPSPLRILVLLVVPLVWTCARVDSGRALPGTPLNVALWCLLIMVAISLYATFDIRFSLGKVAGVVLGVVFFWAVARWVTTADRLKTAMAAYVIAGVGLAVIGLIGTRWIEKFPPINAAVAHLPRLIRGVPGAEEGFQPNAVGGSLLLFVPLQIALLAVGIDKAGRRSRWLRPTQIALLAVTTLTLLLTQSRGAWAGLLVGTIAFFIWHTRTTRILAGVAMLIGLIAVVRMGPGHVADLTISQSGPGMSSDVSERIELWQRAVSGVQDFPITGMGMNTFRTLMPRMYPMFRTKPNFDVAHAHNHLLQAALDLGIPGLIAYLAIWMIAAILLIQVYRQGTEPMYRAMAGGLGVGLIAQFMFGMTDTIALGAKVGILFWFALALVAGLHRVGVRS